MSNGLDVQVHPTGVSISYADFHVDENLPGQLNLTYDEADELRHDLQEAWFNSFGVERVDVPARLVQLGDIFGNIGGRVQSVFTDSGYTTIHLGNEQKLVLSEDVEVTVNRRIE